MARRVFFSFHYERDIFRVNTVRNSDVTKKNVDQSGYWDHSLWEEAKKKGRSAVEGLIAEGLKNTSVTVVLAGLETAGSRWVRYELVKSFERGNGLMTIYINGIKDAPSGTVDTRGPDPLGRLYFTLSGDGKSATVQEYTQGEWKSYMNIDAKYLHPAAKAAKKGFLSVGAQSYDWVTNDGYTNFARWVETAAKESGHS